MGAFKKVVLICLVIAAGTLAGCGSGYSDSQTYPAGTRYNESVSLYDYAEILRAQQEGAYLDHLKRQDQIESWDRTLRSFGRTGRRVTGSIGDLVELQKRRNRW